MARHILQKKSSQVEEEPSVNLTPLIDVVFVILIMFILVAPMLEMEKIELADASLSPKDSQAYFKEESLLSIQVFADDAIELNKIPVSEGRLLDLLKEAKRRQPELVPQLFHDRRATFGTYQAEKMQQK